MAMATVVRSVVMQHCNSAWLTGSGGAPVRQVHTRPRRNHRQQGSEGTNDYAFGNGSGSLEVRCNPPRLIWENDVPMLDVRRARLVPIGRGSAD